MILEAKLKEYNIFVSDKHIRAEHIFQVNITPGSDNTHIATMLLYTSDSKISDYKIVNLSPAGHNMLVKKVEELRANAPPPSTETNQSEPVRSLQI